MKKIIAVVFLVHQICSASCELEYSPTGPFRSAEEHDHYLETVPPLRRYHNGLDHVKKLKMYNPDRKIVPDSKEAYEALFQKYRRDIIFWTTLNIYEDFYGDELAQIEERIKNIIHQLIQSPEETAAIAREEERKAAEIEAKRQQRAAKKAAQEKALAAQEKALAAARAAADDAANPFTKVGKGRNRKKK
jgi:hypothetical protein